MIAAGEASAALATPRPDPTSEVEEGAINLVRFFAALRDLAFLLPDPPFLADVCPAMTPSTFRWSGTIAYTFG